MSEDEPEAESENEFQARVTAPMQEFGMGEVTIGLLVFAVGVALTFLLPLVF